MMPRLLLLTTLFAALLVGAALAGCGEPPEPAPQAPDPNAGTDARPDTIPSGFVVRGVYRGMVYDSAAAIVDHEAVSGVMPAMRMPIRAADADGLRGLRDGDKIRFRLDDPDGTGYVMFDVEPLPPETELALADPDSAAVPEEDALPE